MQVDERFDGGEVGLDFRFQTFQYTRGQFPVLALFPKLIHPKAEQNAEGDKKSFQ